jgi:hypothetical protein
VIPRPNRHSRHLRQRKARGEPWSCGSQSAHQSLINRRLSPPLPTVRSLQILALATASGGARPRP